MIDYKFLIIGWDEECQEYRYPDIVFSSIEFKDDYFDKKIGDKGIKDSIDLSLRSYNHHYRDNYVNGIVVGRLGSRYEEDDTKFYDLYNNFTLEEAEKWYSKCWDSKVGGQLGNIDTSWELSDLTNNDEFISIDDYLPEDLCFCLYHHFDNGLSFTKDCICKFDDGQMKYSHRTMINPSNEDEKIKWIEEWSKRQLKNAKGYYNIVHHGCGGFGPAYHWQMPKEWADRVVAWRWFKEGEKRSQYM